MASVLDKVMQWLGIREEDDDYEEVVDEQIDASYTDTTVPIVHQRERKEERGQERPREGRRRGNLVSLNGGPKQGQVKMLILEPAQFDEVRTFVVHLKEKRAIIVRLDKMEQTVARQVVDFMSGATLALDGNMRKLGPRIFCFAPSSIVLEGEIEQDLEADDLLELNGS